MSPLIAVAIMLAFRVLDSLARWQMRGVADEISYFNPTAVPDRATRGHALRVLRVFAKAGRPQQLLDRVQAQWRPIGPVRQIGGPDLAP